LGTYLNGIKTSASNRAAGRQQIGDVMRRRVLGLKFKVLRHLAVPGLALLMGIGSALAQSGDLRNQDQGKAAANPAAAADAAKDNQRKTDEFVEAAQAINGPAGNPECVWLGRRVVVLMWRDDLDTAFRHLDLYDRFGCPGGHVQATFRCLVRFGAIDPKSPDSLSGRVHACWINPAAQPQAAAAAAPAAGTTSGASTAAAPAPAPAAPPAAAPAAPPAK
jgi:pyruvate/2-oxoglutarate dehydrogenase complex dihydrolipoamide acyltransferase (E2) component